MNTFKMKVLLFLTNRHLFRSLRRASLLWLAVCITGCIVLHLFGFFFLASADDLLPAVVLSLLFSTPAFAMGIVVFYFLHLLPNTVVRIITSAVMIVILSAFIVGIVSVYFNQSYLEVSKVLYPFTLSACVYFFLFARRQVLVSYPA